LKSMKSSSQSHPADPLPELFETMADEHGSIGFLTLPPSAPASATVIWIHGLGDSGYGMEPFAQTLSRYYSCNHIKWILPHAPTMCVTRCKVRMPSWFDLYSFDIPNRPEDEPGLLAAVQQINHLISSEIQSGTPSHRIIVGGLSQGAALAVLTGLTTERKLGGVFALSGYVPLRGKAASICKPLFPSIPLFFAHGTADRQVNHDFARDAARTFASQLDIPFHLSDSSSSIAAAADSDGQQPFSQGDNQGVGPGLTFRSYENMGHEIIETELEDLRLWIGMILAKEGAGGTEERQGRVDMPN